MPQRDGPRLADRNGKIWEEYLLGHTQETIASRHGICQERVSQIITATRASIPQTNKADAALLALERLRLMLTGVLPDAIKGDTRASAAALRIIEREAKMLGLDSPEPLSIILERRRDLESRLVADAVNAALDVLDLTEEQRRTALDAARQKLLDPDGAAGTMITYSDGTMPA